MNLVIEGDRNHGRRSHPSSDTTLERAASLSSEPPRELLHVAIGAVVLTRMVWRDSEAVEIIDWGEEAPKSTDDDVVIRSTRRKARGATAVGSAGAGIGMSIVAPSGDSSEDDDDDDGGKAERKYG